MKKSKKLADELLQNYIQYGSEALQIENTRKNSHTVA
jgi:hypothetical protein